jgi:hypothetical protein
MKPIKRGNNRFNATSTKVTATSTIVRIRSCDHFHFGNYFSEVINHFENW